MFCVAGLHTQDTYVVQCRRAQRGMVIAASLQHAKQAARSLEGVLAIY